MNKNILAQFYANNNLIDNIKTLNQEKILKFVRNTYSEEERAEHAYIVNQHMVYLWMADRIRWDEPLNFTDVQDIHFTMFRHIHPDKLNGKIRTIDKKVRRYDCPKPKEINHLIDKFENLLLLVDDIIIYGDEIANLLFWHIHNVFECIQPFAYGNGRIGRFLFNICRMRHGMDINIWNIKKSIYYDEIKKFEEIFKARYNS